MMKKRKAIEIFKYFPWNLIFLPAIFFIVGSCNSTYFELKTSKESAVSIENAKKLKKLTNETNLIEISSLNREKIYENKDSKFYLFNLSASNTAEILPEYTTRFSPKTEISYVYLINRYYNSKQLQKVKWELNHNPNSIYIPSVEDNLKDFWYVFMIPTSVGFKEIEIDGKKIQISKNKSKIPTKLTPYSSVELKLLRKNLINSDNKNYLQINVNQMLNSFAFRKKVPNCPKCTESTFFGFLETEKYPNYKLIFDSLDYSKKIIKFKISKKTDNLKQETNAQNEIDSNISIMNFVYKTKEYKQSSNPDNYFEKNTEIIDKISEFPFVRFYTQTFVVPFEGSESDFDSNFSIKIE
ncbi:hypothetical protein DR094_01150 [Mycoplasma flocculare]|uniref:Lipoprotein n=1 Tax=Mesomycoplasma flocculare TaxID=2128 RepID=A0AAW9X9R2_MESFC|nr:hypothetical protein [Mesomycoplasma flocculare]MXR05621.1 hypothetical protein [Mesomycoplasma flocculare]MXR11992.1 hypothetical protein [Mesomycoplasma flocculare]MXR39208.1 hypothetical protein [Mycoplasma sp. MF12]MXR56603.1 hypothetical protein [Mesomycoplasma flocculare]